MHIGMVGLGRMGANMVRRLMRGGHEAVAFDLNPQRARELATEGASARQRHSTNSSRRFVRPAPCGSWCRPASRPSRWSSRWPTASARATRSSTAATPTSRTTCVERRRSRPDGIDYVDVGTSGGLWGLDRGYSLMIGGAPTTVGRLDPIFRTLAPGHDDTPPTPGRAGGGTAEKGYLHCGPAGAGHFVKMVHNGIEYGLMQAYAEGFDIMRHAGDAHLPADQRYDYNLADIAEVWRHGSVVGSWLLDLTASALAEDPALSQFTGHVQDSGEGRWTIEAAIAEAVPVEVLASALFARFRSRQDHTFAEKVLSAMRFKFGGHVERAAGG